MRAAMECDATMRNGGQLVVAEPIVSAGARVAVLKGDARLFGGLASRRFHPLLAKADETVVAIGAIAGARPVGLALGTRHEGGGVELLSIAVAPGLRRKGLGLALVKAFEEEARHRGGREIAARINETMAGRAAFETLMAKAGWRSAVEEGLVVVGRAGAMADVAGTWPAISRRIERPDAYRFEPLVLSDADRDDVRRYLSLPGSADMYGPLDERIAYERDYSIAIRRRGRLIGWLMATPADRTFVEADHPGRDLPALRYLEAFVDPDYWHSGITVAAYHHCYARQAQAFGHHSLAIYYTSPGRPRMVALTRRRFAALADRLETIFAFRRSL